jgi:hypothetical protein
MNKVLKPQYFYQSFYAPTPLAINPFGLEVMVLYKPFFVKRVRLRAPRGGIDTQRRGRVY